MEEKNQGIGGITFTGPITVNGPMFDIHDNQHVHIHANGEERSDAEETREAPSDEGLVAKLMPIFYNNEEDVRQFLKEIQGMAQENITELVNQWVKDKRISDYGNSKKGKLWGILHETGLYLRSKQNWNERVK